MLLRATGDGHEGIGECSLARCDRECGETAFQLGDPFFQNVCGWICDPAVAVAWTLKIEQRGSLVRAFEFIGHVLIDWRRHRPRRGIAAETAMNRNCLRPHGEFPVLPKPQCQFRAAVPIGVRQIRAPKPSHRRPKDMALGRVLHRSQREYTDMSKDRLQCLL